MRHIIVDTDVVSCLMRGDQRARDFMPFILGKIPAITFVTVAELHFGAIADNWGAKRMGQLEQTIRRYALLPWDPNLPKIWARLRADAKRVGSPLYQAEHTNDLWIAACAVYYQAPLLTGNRRHMLNLPGLVLADDEDED